MVLANTSSIVDDNYVDVLERAGLHEAFENAWDCELDDHIRSEEGLDSVSEDKIIEKTLANAEELWGFSMRVNNDLSYEDVEYHLVPFQEEMNSELIGREQHADLILIQRDVLQDIESHVDTISHALDNITYTLNDVDL
jgi:hypothetical protein